MEDKSSDGSTIIEIEGRDRPGLLCELAECLRADDLSIQSAHIEVVGNKAIDAFYVCCETGNIAAERKTKLKKSLLETLKIKVPA